MKLRHAIGLWALETHHGNHITVEFALRVPATADLSGNEEGTGRELFKAFRNLAGRADQGASIFEVA